MDLQIGLTGDGSQSRRTKFLLGMVISVAEELELELEEEQEQGAHESRSLSQ